MEKFIPYEKLSKKEKRKMDLAKRQTWGAFDPVTRKPQNSKAYNRNKSRNWKRDYHETNSGAFLFKSRLDVRSLDFLVNFKLAKELFCVILGICIACIDHMERVRLCDAINGKGADVIRICHNRPVQKADAHTNRHQRFD